jgi:hypothetical protein
MNAIRPGQYYVLAIGGGNPTSWYGATWENDGPVNNADTVAIRAGESSLVDLRTSQ